jgi:hypothetical protein
MTSNSPEPTINKIPCQTFTIHHARRSLLVHRRAGRFHRICWLVGKQSMLWELRCCWKSACPMAMAVCAPARVSRVQWLLHGGEDCAAGNQRLAAWHDRRHRWDWDAPVVVARERPRLLLLGGPQNGLCRAGFNPTAFILGVPWASVPRFPELGWYERAYIYFYMSALFFFYVTNLTYACFGFLLRDEWNTVFSQV